MNTDPNRLKLAIVQMNPTVGDLAGNALAIVRTAQEAAALGADLVLFPEMALTGYPPEDLILVPAFRQAAWDAARQIAKDTQSLPCDLIFGNLWEESEPGEPAMSPRSGAQASPVGDLPKPLKISFTPHLVPFTRGMLSTIHVQLADGRTADDARACLQQAYANEPFVQVLASGSPRTHEVRGTNQCFMSVHAGRRTGELIIVSVIDNLVKGASGQALQNANLMIGEPEATNLELTAVFP